MSTKIVRNTTNNRKVLWWGTDPYTFLPNSDTAIPTSVASDFVKHKDFVGLKVIEQSEDIKPELEPEPEPEPEPEFDLDTANIEQLKVKFGQLGLAWNDDWQDNEDDLDNARAMIEEKLLG